MYAADEELGPGSGAVVVCATADVGSSVVADGVGESMASAGADVAG